MYRLARGPADPFTPPPWDLALEDGTFGNRFDDPAASRKVSPDQRFRMIYCATQRVAAFGETVARFRPSISLLSQLESVRDDEPIGATLAGAVDPEDVRRGLIPADWRLRRRMGRTVLEPTLRFVDLAAMESMQYLRSELATLADRLGVKDIDLGSLTGPDREFTQWIARHIHDLHDESGRPLYAGVRYLSRLNAEWECWAVFDDRIRHAHGWPAFPAAVHADDDDLLLVAEQFNLTIEVFQGQSVYIRP